jgi:hypothetical protein
MENSIEEAIKIMEHWIEYEKNNKEKINRADELINIQETILSAYKRVLKENEILKEEKEQAWEEWNNLEQGSYGTEQKLKQQIKELRKENEELNNRCRNLDKEAQAYLEELAGDNTLTRRTIKQLQKENKELKNDYENLSNSVVVKNYYIENSIPVQKVKDKIEEEKLPLVIVGGRRNKRTLEYGIKLGRRQALQELLEGRE